MSRRLTGAVLLAVVAALAPASAARAEEATASGGPANSAALTGTIGLALGGRTSPGGLEIGGAYLYRLSERDWLEASAGFTFGGGGAACFRDRADAVVCDHGLFGGFAGEAGASVRRYLGGRGGFDPYASLGLGVRVVSFGEDEVRGVAVPLLVGGGVRAEVAGDVDLVAGGVLRVGIGSFGRGLGAEPQLSLSIVAGVEFALD